MLAAVVVAFALLSLPRDRGPLPLPRLPLAPAPADRAPAPAFELPLVGGGTASLAEMRGSVVLVNFWATWCGPCRRELPALGELEAKLGPQGLRVLAVNVDKSTTDALARFVAERTLGFAVLHDRDHAVADHYGVRAYPTAVVVDRAGRIVVRYTGAVAWDAPTTLVWLGGLLREPAQ